MNSLRKRVLGTIEGRRAYCRDALVLQVTNHISRLLEEQGLSRAELAQRLGTTRSYVSQVLGGRKNLTLGTVSDILFALDQILDTAVRSPEDTFIELPHELQPKASFNPGSDAWSAKVARPQLDNAPLAA